MAPRRLGPNEAAANLADACLHVAHVQGRQASLSVAAEVYSRAALEAFSARGARCSNNERQGGVLMRPTERCRASHEMQ